jgi:hypothetical protein
MPRLIELDKSVEKKVTHRECGAVIGYYQNEVQDGGVYEDYGGGRELWYYIVCPNCGKKVEVKGS